MKLTHEQPIRDIYRVAVAFSAETRGQVVADMRGPVFSPETDVWEQIRDSRTDAQHALRAAGRSLVKLANVTARPYVTHAVKSLLAAVEELANYRPEYAERANEIPPRIAKRMGLADTKFTTWAPTESSVKELDELRNRARVAFITLESLFEKYDSPAARLLDVAGRIAGFVLEPTAAGLVKDWLAKLERGDSGATA
jgi:hypothetical protein